MVKGKEEPGRKGMAACSMGRRGCRGRGRRCCRAARRRCGHTRRGAGRLPNNMIQACGLKRDDVYILNVLKCRPPGNRNPLPDEVTNCRGYFERQLAIVRPEVICCLGAVAAKSLLCTETSIGKLRGS